MDARSDSRKRRREGNGSAATTGTYLPPHRSGATTGGAYQPPHKRSKGAGGPSGDGHVARVHHRQAQGPPADGSVGFGSGRGRVGVGGGDVRAGDQRRSQGPQSHGYRGENRPGEGGGKRSRSTAEPPQTHRGQERHGGGGGWNGGDRGRERHSSDGGRRGTDRSSRGGKGKGRGGNSFGAVPGRGVLMDHKRVPNRLRDPTVSRVGCYSGLNHR